MMYTFGFFANMIAAGFCAGIGLTNAANGLPYVAGIDFALVGLNVAFAIHTWSRR